MEEEREQPVLSHYSMALNAHASKKAKDSRYKDKSKKRLSNIFTTKMKTCFIGAISSCENNLGFLWGHGKDEEELTEQERKMREIWEIVRAEILDNGNSQLRASINEINNYTVNWNRYQINFNMNEEQED